MSDFLTALAAVLDSVTRPEFVIIVGPIAVVAGLFIYAEHRADKVRRTREELTAATVAHIGTCGEVHGALVCGRAADHARDFHPDWSKDTERPIRWRVARGGAA